MTQDRILLHTRRKRSCGIDWRCLHLGTLRAWASQATHIQLPCARFTFVLRVRVCAILGSMIPITAGHIALCPCPSELPRSWFPAEQLWRHWLTFACDVMGVTHALGLTCRLARSSLFGEVPATAVHREASPRTTRLHQHHVDQCNQDIL